MDKITVYRDEGPDIRFAGVLMAEVSSKAPNREQPRWTELRLYQTEGGQYVAHEIGRTTKRDEKTLQRAEVMATLDEVRAFFKYGWLAKELYRKAGIDAAEDVA